MCLVLGHILPAGQIVQMHSNLPLDYMGRDVSRIVSIFETIYYTMSGYLF